MSMPKYGPPFSDALCHRETVSGPCGGNTFIEWDEYICIACDRSNGPA